MGRTVPGLRSPVPLRDGMARFTMPSGALMERHRTKYTKWTFSRTRRFVSDWNDGLSQEALSEKYAIDRGRVYRLVCELREKGFDIESRPHGGLPDRDDMGDITTWESVWSSSPYEARHVSSSGFRAINGRVMPAPRA